MNVQGEHPLPKPKAQRGRPPNSSSRATRERLMRSAAAHFSAAEFSDVSMEAIAAEAGVTGGAIYNHFPSKDGLFVATVEHLMAVNLTVIAEAIDGQSDARSMVRAILILISTNKTGWFHYPLLVTAVQLKSLQNRELFREVLALRRRFAEQFERIVACAVAERDLPDDIDQGIAAELLMAFVFNGLGTVMSHHAHEGRLDTLIDATMALLGIRPPQPAD